ncbi:RNA-binding domain-containing protein [Calocera viscosa TUFC12733]|uniref:RNA-binding domain-containing protein n=1 Tax=Calocera viscosa (strain TUFC12733) TaxID=1330018 RepID=A0A167RB12_CALVF|nr:RNA-binding domain-containing protein [Calocera viscosa TUFC12733]
MEGDLSLEQRIGDEPSTDHTLNGHDTEVDQVPIDDSDTARDGDSPTKGGFGGRWKGQREAKPNKVYIGGLPETTRQEDLQNCFGKLGNVTNIELKLGYGFVEFDNVKAAEEAVAKYNEGFFMGSKIKVEQSHGGGRTSKYNNDPGACFKCGQHGHWARECPTGGAPVRKYGGYARSGGPDSAVDRPSHGPKDYGAPPPTRDFGRYDDYRDRDRYAAPPPRDSRYDYSRPPLPPRDTRDYRDPRDVRLPPSPPRDYPRDYAGAPPPRRDYDEYRRPEGRVPPPPALPPARYEARPYYPEPSSYGPPPAAGYPPPRVPDYPPPLSRPPVADPYVARPYERRDSSGGAPPPPPPVGDKYGYPPVPPAGRPRSPPVLPVRNGARDDYDRGPVRDYGRAPDYRARSPPPANGATRYPEYPPRDATANGYRYGTLVTAGGQILSMPG